MKHDNKYNDTMKSFTQVQTEAQGGLFFFKQWGTWGSDGVKRSKHKNGKMFDGKILQAMPKV